MAFQRRPIQFRHPHVFNRISTTALAKPTRSYYVPRASFAIAYCSNGLQLQTGSMNDLFDKIRRAGPRNSETQRPVRAQR